MSATMPKPRQRRGDLIFSGTPAGVGPVKSGDVLEGHVDGVGEVLAPGAAADIVVFDPATVRDAATFDAPHAYAEGIPYVLVNGVFVVRGGASTDARPGAVLARPAISSR